MVTVFTVENTNNALCIDRYLNNDGQKIQLKYNNPGYNHDYNNYVTLPNEFKISMFEDWDTYDKYIVAKITSDINDFSLINVIVDKYLLFNIVKEKDCFVTVGDKVFYLEDPNLMLYRTDHVPTN